MPSINWKQTQLALAKAGYNPGPADGLPGRMTYAALFGYMAGRQPDATLRALGASAASAFSKYGVDGSPSRLAEFMAQTSHETGGYTRFEENMHYSAKRLTQVWPSRFPTVASALPYAWDPSDPDREDIALANKVYGGRMGNEKNGTNDNDGWDHRGGGLIQHTGFQEYEALRKRLGYTAEDVHTDLTKMVVAACDFWQRANVNGAVDAGDFRLARRRTNGGYIGLDDVAARRARCLRVVS